MDVVIKNVGWGISSLNGRSDENNSGDEWPIFSTVGNSPFSKCHFEGGGLALSGWLMDPAMGVLLVSVLYGLQLLLTPFDPTSKDIQKIKPNSFSFFTTT